MYKGSDTNCGVSLVFHIQAPAFVKMILILSQAFTIRANVVSTLVFFISQLQIFAILANTAKIALETDSEGLQTFFKSFHNIFCLSGLYSDKDTLVWGHILLYLIYIYLLLMILYLFYLYIVISQKGNLFESLNCILSSLFAIHPFILFYPIHYLLLSRLFGTALPFSNYGFVRIVEIIVVIVVATVNFVFTALSLIFLNPKTKTKNAFSMKTSINSVATLILKLALSLCWFINTSSRNAKIIMLLISILLNLLKDWFFFKTLPFYRVEILKVSIIFKGIFTSCAVSCIITKIVGSIRTIDQLKFATMLWIILSLCFIYFYSQILHKILLNILLNPSQIQNRYHVIHYWYIYAYISTRRIKPVEMTREIDKNYFYFYSKWNQTEITKQIFNEKQPTIDDIANYDSLVEQAIRDQTINTTLEMLKTALKRNKNSTLLKATLVLYYLKYQKLYIRVDHNITEEISGSTSMLLKIPFYYLKLRLIRDMKEDSNTPIKASNIDIHQHAQLKEIFEDMIAFMKKEISYRLNFWQEFQNSAPELSDLIKYGNEAYNYSQKLNKFWVYHDKFIQAGYTEPLFAFGLYFEHVHGLPSAGEKLIRKYFDLKYKAKNDHFHHDLTGSFSDAIHLVVSGTSQQLGIILDCSKNVDKYLGIQKNDLLKSSINILMPLFFQKYHDNFLEETVNTENSKVLDKTRKVVVLQQDGYIMYYWIHITLTLLSDHGVCYHVVLRPINDNKRRILVKGNGLIANVSENFAQDLKKSLAEITNKHVNQFCSKLEYVLHVFKIKAIMKSQQKVTFSHLENIEAQSNKEKALQPIIDAYTKGEKLLFLTSESHSPLETKSIDKILADNHLVLYNAEIQYYVHKDDILFQITMNILYINDLSPAELKQMVLFQKIRHRVSGSRQRSSHFSFDMLKETDSKFVLATTLIMNKNRINEKKVLIQEPHESPKHGTDSLSSPKSTHKSGHKIYTISSEDSAGETHPYQNLGSNPDVNPNPMSSSIKVKEDPNLIHQNIESKTSPSPGTFEIDEKFKKNKFQLEPPSNVIDGDQESVSLEFQIPGQKDDPGFSTVGSPTILLKKVVFESNEDSMKPDIRELEKEVKVTRKRLQSENQETRSATRSSSQYNNRVHKEIQLAINSKKHPKTTIVYYISYFVSLFAILFYLNWVSFDMIHVSEDVSTLRTVVDNMYLRNFWIKLANQETRLWTAVRGGVINIPGIVDMETEIATTTFAFNQVSQFNQNLSVSIDTLDKKIQNILFERNVKIIVRDQDNSISIQTIDNTFTAVDKILSNGLKNIQKPIPDAPIENYVDPNSRFIFDNSMNDLLIVSENDIVIVENYISNSIQSSRDTLIIPLVIVLLVLLVFVVFSFRFVITLSSEYSKFMDILFTVAPEETMKIETTLNIFQELLKDFSSENEQIEALNSIKIQEKIRQTNAKKQNSKIEKKGLRPKVSFRKFKTRNNLLLVAILLVLIATSGLIVGYYELVLDRLSKMEKQQTTSSAALYYINVNSLISVELQTMLMDNATTTIRNLHVIQTLEADIQTLGKVADIQARFENENGVLSPEQKIIFNNFPCSEAYSPLYFLSEDVTTGECETLSNGGGSVGLGYVISTMAGKLDLFISQFQTSTRTQDELETMYRQAIDTFIQYIDVSTTLFLISFKNVSKEFTDLVNRVDSDSRLFIGLAFVASFIIGTIGWRFIIKNLGQKQLKRKRILSVLPLGLILANPYLKKCAIKM